MHRQGFHEEQLFQGDDEKLLFLHGVRAQVRVGQQADRFPDLEFEGADAQVAPEVFDAGGVARDQVVDVLGIDDEIDVRPGLAETVVFHGLAAHEERLFAEGVVEFVEGEVHWESRCVDCSLRFSWGLEGEERGFICFLPMKGEDPLVVTSKVETEGMM